MGFKVKPATSGWPLQPCLEGRTQTWGEEGERYRVMYSFISCIYSGPTAYPGIAFGTDYEGCGPCFVQLLPLLGDSRWQPSE